MTEQRIHISKRGETLHGIAKRATGETNPSVLAGWVQAFSHANAGLHVGALPEGTRVLIPAIAPAQPKVGWPDGSMEDRALRIDHSQQLAYDLERLRGEADAVVSDLVSEKRWTHILSWTLGASMAVNVIVALFLLLASR
jgi:hypothetical protein